MVELAVRPGWQSPDGLPRGECILTRLEDGSIRVDHADPRVLISAELLAMIFTEAVPGVSLSAPAENANGTPFWEGAVLKIEAVNRTVIYRITGYVPAVHGYIGEWPD